MGKIHETNMENLMIYWIIIYLNCHFFLQFSAVICICLCNYIVLMNIGVESMIFCPGDHGKENGAKHHDMTVI